MSQYVALLRGINVGGNNKVEMSRLKKAFESLGYVHVQTYINSGNVVFETKTDDRENIIKNIERELKKEFGLSLRVVLLSAKKFQTICQHIPSTWFNDNEQRTDVLFLWDEFDSPKSLKLISTNPDVDTLKYIKGAIVWHFKRINYTKSAMRKFIVTPIYKNMTARNVNTVRKINSLFEKTNKKVLL